MVTVSTDSGLRERASLLVFCTPPFQMLCSIVVQCGVCWAEKTLMEDSFKDALLPMRGGVGSLFSQGQRVPPYLCCRRPWVPSGCLTP